MNTNIYLKISNMHIGFSAKIHCLHQQILGSAQIMNKININPHPLRVDQYSKNCRINDVFSRRYSHMNLFNISISYKSRSLIGRCVESKINI